MHRLNAANLSRLPSLVDQPEYDRDRAGFGIIHLGIGAFHRAHQAVYTDTAMARQGGDWKICGVSLRSPAVRDQMTAQDCLFTVTERTLNHSRIRVIGAVGEVVFAPENPPLLLARLAAPSIRIVSLTITEKGYHHDPASGRLNPSHPDIAADLANAAAPRTAIGYLVRSLEMRRKSGGVPFTVMSCDNLPENGRTLRTVVLDFAKLINDDLAAWIEREVAFPCSMVDRIVPPTEETDRAMLASVAGIRDEAAVVTEPFSQWVIEDAFPQGRPAWDLAGATFSQEVKAFERMKLRLLNGAHSSLAYLGYLSGLETIADCMRNPELRAIVSILMQREILPTLQPPSGYNAADYIETLLERFANPTLNHRTWHIAMDGSQKLPQRLLDTIREQLAPTGAGNIDCLALAVAAWMRYVCGVDENGAPIDVRDPFAGIFAARTAGFMDEPDKVVDNLLELKEVFAGDLAANPLFRIKVQAAFQQLVSEGTRKTLALCLRNVSSTPAQRRG